MTFSGVWRYVLLFLTVLLLCTALLWASSLLPQERIDANVSRSAERLAEEGPYAYILDGRRSAVLDNYTDSIILTVCKSTDSADPLSFLTNPMFDGSTPVEKLSEYCRGEAEPDGHYVRYWLGFRIFLRPLLCFIGLRELRYLMIALMLSLLGLVFLSVGKNVSRATGAAFLLSMLLIRPYVCSRCMQFACCPFIALLAMLCVPYAAKKPRRVLPFFMVLGMLTMFFDFYTVPILTFGMPMIFYLCLRTKQGEALSAAEVIKALALWLAGYVFMWFAKMALCTLFTPYNGFSNGFREFVHWVGKNGGSASEQFGLGDAFRAVFAVICPDALCKGILGGAAALFLVCLLLGVAGGRRKELGRSWPVLSVGLLPLVWFACSVKPITMHAFFQYRSIAVLYWALGAWVSTALPKRKTAL